MFILHLIIALAPVFCFLAVLIVIDSYKLVRFQTVLLGNLAGIGAAAAAFGIHRWILKSAFVDSAQLSHYIAPVVEEFLKGLYLVFLIRSRRVGFMVDSAICGFAIGAGFAAIENLYYLYQLENQSLLIWIVRGFGTAIMHGGTTAILGILGRSVADRRGSEKWIVFVPGIAVAIVIHAIYNYFILPPAISTLIMMIVFPTFIVVVFERSEQALKEWLGMDLDSDMTILEMIRSGHFLASKVGQYLQSLKSYFAGEILADMLCYIRLHVELAIKAKGLLMIREAGFEEDPGCDVREKFQELRYLEKSIGKTGKLAIAPLLRTSSKNLWQLQMLLKI